jgi:hypothetical protein
LPLYRKRFGLDWAKAFLLTIVTWYALNLLGSMLLAVFSL